MICLNKLNFMKLNHYFNNLSLSEKDNLVASICTLETIQTTLTPYEISNFTTKYYDEFSEFLYNYLEENLDSTDVDDAYDSTILWFNSTNFATICKKFV